LGYRFISGWDLRDGVPRVVIQESHPDIGLISATYDWACYGTNSVYLGWGYEMGLWMKSVTVDP
jgi:hypothetical protein